MNCVSDMSVRRTATLEPFPIRRCRGSGPSGLCWLLALALQGAGWPLANAQSVTWTFVPQSEVLPADLPHLPHATISAIGGQGELVIRHGPPGTGDIGHAISMVTDQVARLVFVHGDPAPGGGTFLIPEAFNTPINRLSWHVVSAERLLFQVNVSLLDDSISRRTFRWDNGQIIYLPPPGDTEYRLDINDGQGRFLAVRYRVFEGLFRFPVEFSITDGEVIGPSVQPLPINEGNPVFRGFVGGITPEGGFLVEEIRSDPPQFFTSFYYVGGQDSVVATATTTDTNDGSSGSKLDFAGTNENGDVALWETRFTPDGSSLRLWLHPSGTGEAVVVSMPDASLAMGEIWLTRHPQVIYRARLAGGPTEYFTGPNSEDRFGGNFVGAFGLDGRVTSITAFHQNGYISVGASLVNGSFVRAFGRAETSQEGGEKVWNNSAGGMWSEAEHWEPPEVPDHSSERSDTAVFSLAGRYPINATGARAGRMIVRNGILDLTGNAQALSSSLTEPSLLVGVNGILNVVSGTFQSVHAMLGDASTGTGEVAVLNQGTRWENNGRLLVGAAGPGKLSVVNSFASALETRIGGGALAGGDVVVGGATGRWDPGSLAVGFAGPGRLEVRDGGEVVSEAVVIGRAGAGELRIRHAEMISRDLRIGENAEGILRLEQGARLGSGDALIGVGGSNGPGRGAVVVDGGGQAAVQTTQWLTIGLTVGGGAPGELRILNGGRVMAMEQAFVGEAAAERLDLAADGSILVRGGTPGLEPSRLFLLKELMLGMVANAVADVQIRDGGEVIATEDFYLGFEAGSSGFLSVNGVNEFGARARMLVGSDDPAAEGGVTCRVGYHGAGVLTIGEGGLVVCPNLLIGGLEGSSGMVEVGGSMGRFTSELRVTGDRFAVGGVSGLGSLDGVEGRLNLKDGLVVTAGELWISEQGVLTGQGTIVAHTIVANGYLSPAFFPTVSAAVARPGRANETETPPPGVLRFDGNLQLGPTGVIRVEVRGAEPGNQTRLEVLGTATLNGRLELNFSNGYAPRQGDQLRFITAKGGVNGGFAGVTLAGLAPGFEYDLDASGGEVRLTALNDAVVTAPPRFAPQPAVTSEGLRLSVEAPAEQEVVIFATPGVLTPAQPIHTNRGSFILIDPLPPGQDQRFYRAVGR